jgi:hypothetical protein
MTNRNPLATAFDWGIVLIAAGLFLVIVLAALEIL